MKESEINKILGLLLATLGLSLLSGLVVAVCGDTPSQGKGDVALIFAIISGALGFAWVLLSLLAIPRMLIYLFASVRNKERGRIVKALAGLFLSLSPFLMWSVNMIANWSIKSRIESIFRAAH